MLLLRQVNSPFYLFCFSFLFLGFSAKAWSVSYYECKNDEGRYFSTDPCPGGVIVFTENHEPPQTHSSPKTFETTLYANLWFEGARGHKMALKLSSEYKVPIIYYFYTDWCHYCRRFERDLLEDRSVKRSISHFVKVRINPEDSGFEKKISENFNVRGYPTVLVQSVNSNSTKRVSVLSRQKSGKAKSNRFIKNISRYL